MPVETDIAPLRGISKVTREPDLSMAVLGD